MKPRFVIRSVSHGKLWQVWFWEDYQAFKLGIPAEHLSIAFGLTIPEAWENAKRWLKYHDQ